MTSIGQLLARAAPGEVVEIPVGRYADETFPLTVPPGVTLRGTSARGTVIGAGGSSAVVLADGAALAHVTVTSVTGRGNAVRITECHVQSIALRGGEGHVVANNVVAGGQVSCAGTTSVTVRGNYVHGLQTGAGIDCDGGSGHVIEDNECCDDLCGIRCTSTVGAQIVRNRCEACWFGVYLLDAEGTIVRRNQARCTVRAVNVEGGAANRVERQLAEHCDTGVVVERGATGAVVADSWLHDCRVGVLVQAAGGVVTLERTAVTAPRDHAIVTDETLAVVDADLDGDIWSP